MAGLLPPPGSVGLSPGRPDALRLSSPTAVQFVVLCAALLTAGLFAGNWLHDATTAGDAWQLRVRECWSSDTGGTAVQQAEHQRRFEACMQAAERQRGAYALGGMAAAVAGSCVALIAAPVVIERRRRLRPLPSQVGPIAERARAISRRLGIDRTPDLQLGTLKMHDAFSYGLPHSYRIAVPPKLAVSIRHPGVLDPVLAHELAHVARHDVTYAWVARTVWYAVLPVLAVPFVISTLRGDVSLTVDFVLRAAALLAVVRLITAALLRVREHEADLMAVHAVGREGVEVGLRAASSRPDRGRLHAVLALHPTPAERMRVLDDPARLARPTFVDGLTAGFLSGVASSLLLAALATLLTGSGLVDLAHVITAAVTGGALGAFIGLTAWRVVLFDRLLATATSLWPFATGVGVGLLVGELLSLGQTATQGVAEPVVTRWLLTLPVVGAGATALVRGLAELWADGAARRGRAPHVVPPLVGGTVVATAVLSMLLLRPVFDGGPVAGLEVFAAARVGGVVALVVLGLAGTAAAWARGGHVAGSPAPTWLMESGTAPWAMSSSPRTSRLVTLGLLAGGTGGMAVIGYRVVVGPVSQALVEARYLHYLGVGAAVAAAVMLVFCLALPGVGPGSGLVAGIVAAVAVDGAVLLLVVVLGGSLGVDIVQQSVQATLGLGVLLSVATAVTGLLPVRYEVRPRGLGVMAVVLALIASLTVLHAAPSATPVDDLRTYEDITASSLVELGSELAATFETIATDPTSTDRQKARRFRAEALPLLVEMRARASSAQPSDSGLRAAHALVVESIDTAERGVAIIAGALDAADPEQYRAGFALWYEANQLWGQWRAALDDLAAAVGQSHVTARGSWPSGSRTRRR